MALDDGGRMLWDMGYVKGGCQGDPPPGTNYDNTPGTYVTNYVIGLVAVIGIFQMFRRRPDLYKVLSVSFLLWTGLGYGLAGVAHQFILTEETVPLNIATYVLAVMGCLALNLLILDEVLPLSIVMGKIAAGVAILVGLGAAAVVAVTGNFGIAGIYQVVVLLCATIIWACMRKWDLALGALVCSVSLPIQALLAPVCGNGGYSDCWKDCPLPAPYFNHNALFHAVFAVGLLILALRMGIEKPSAVNEQEGFGLIETKWEEASQMILPEATPKKSSDWLCCG